MAPWRPVVLAIAILALAACGLWGSLMTIEMVEETNRMKSENGHISDVGYYPAKNLTIWREHRRLFPKSRLRARFIILVVSGMIFLLMGAWALGFF